MRDHRVLSRWKPIPSCPGYSASDYGRIHSSYSGRMLLGTDDRYGYRCVNILVDGKRVKRKVHRLVCEAWHGPCPKGCECGHLDGVKSNNRADNLAWITRHENMQHQYAHGKRNRPTPRVRKPSRYQCLTPEKVLEIRRRAGAGESGRSIARALKINQPYVAEIIRGDAWNGRGRSPDPHGAELHRLRPTGFDRFREEQGE